MSELSPSAPDLAARLQEIDRSLREIQAGLLPERRPAELPPEPGAELAGEPEREAELAQPPERGAELAQPPERGLAEPSETRLAEEPEARMGEPSREPRPAGPPEPRMSGEPPEVRPPEPPPRVEPPHEQPPDPGLEPRRGRSGPLAALLQRAAGEGPEPGDPSNPGDESDAGDGPALGDEPMRRDEPARRPDELIEQIAALTGLHVKLLEAYQLVLEQLRPAQAAPEPAATQAAAPQASAPQASAPQAAAPLPSTAAEVTLSVGPFGSTNAVRAFERALAGIPGVREVAIRGYDGENRAIMDVQLAGPTS